MSDTPVQLAELSEAARAEALKKYQFIQLYLENGIPLTSISKQHCIPLRTLRRWIKRYREGGFKALIHKSAAALHYTGKEESLMNQLIEGLLLQKPKLTIACINRMVNDVADKQQWSKTSYSSVYRIAKGLDKKLLLLAHEGSKAYRNKFDLIYRRESEGANDIWQADHCLLDCWISNAKEQLARPWLTIILDDHSRAVCGYLLSFDAPCSMNTALAQHQAIWRKADPRWQIQGIPSCFYTDHGSDFTSKHMEQVAADLIMELIFSLPGNPRGRGKIERFFRTVNDTFLSTVPGFENRQIAKPITLTRLTELFHAWLMEKYMINVHSETGCQPQQRWAEGGFLPRQVDSLEQLDLLLYTVPTSRKIHQDGIHYQGLRYVEPTLAAFVGESVTIRYDPRDLAEVRVFYEDKFLCRALCTQLESDAISLKEIVRARNQKRKDLKAKLISRSTVVAEYIAAHVADPVEQLETTEDTATSAEPKLRRYRDDY